MQFGFIIKLNLKNISNLWINFLDCMNTKLINKFNYLIGINFTNLILN